MKVLILTMVLVALSYPQDVDPRYYTRGEVKEAGNGIVIVETEMTDNYPLADTIFYDTISNVSMLHWLYDEYRANDYFYHGKISGFGRNIDSLVAQEEMSSICPLNDVVETIVVGETYVHVSDTIKIDVIKDYKGNIGTNTILRTSEFFGKCYVTEEYDGAYTGRFWGKESMLYQEFIEYGDKANLPYPGGCVIPVADYCWDHVGFFVDSLGMITKSGFEIPIGRNKWADWPIIKLSLSQLDLAIETGNLPPIPTVSVYLPSHQPLQSKPLKIFENYNVKGQFEEAGSKYLRFLFSAQEPNSGSSQ